MSDKKNIDRLFQEKFKDFEASPSEDNWKNIEARLDGKRRRRIVPFWWKLTGVAAVFLLGFFISKSIYDKGNKIENPIVNQNDSAIKNSTINNDGKNIKNPVITTENKKDAAVVNKTEENKNNRTVTQPKQAGSTGTGFETIAESHHDVNKTPSVEEKIGLKKAVYYQKPEVADKKSSHKRSLKNNTNTGKESIPLTEVIEDKSGLAQHQNSRDAIPQQGVAQVQSKQGKENLTQTPSDPKNINLDDLKGESNSKIATKEIEKKVNDTASKNSVATNALEELLNEKESKVKESKRNRWQLTSNVAPVFLGSVSNGSPIDSTLTKNSKSYNTNIGFGIGVSYAVNKKLSIRTGLNKVDMSYDTNDIVFFTGIQAKTLDNVHTDASSAMIHVESTSAGSSSTFSSENGLLPFESAITNKNDGYLKQEMGYLEMPLELTYNLIDKKFGLKLIGGVSTLFLQDNRIIIVSHDRETQLGEATNLNDVHFSTNFGLGIKYNFAKSFEFNIEPTVKYQLNTFSDNAGNFKPYLFGIYSGISYKF